jgi:hypothetical protein
VLTDFSTAAVYRNATSIPGVGTVLSLSIGLAGLALRRRG